MPEGDTILRTAVRLRPELVGQTITAASARDQTLAPETLQQRQITLVEARGKHLLMHLDDGRTIHSHMGMTGSWHVYRHGERWLKPERRAALVVEVPSAVCVCFTPMLLELLTPAQLRRHRWLRMLGPDLLAGVLDEDEVLRRFRLHDPTPVGEAVMNQSIVCGIGNIYKSETLFITRTDPFVAVGQLSDAQVLMIVGKAQRLMARNLQTAVRRTRTGAGSCFWVYERSGQSCFVCGSTIHVRRQGDLGRTTFWCPACQGQK